MKILAIDDEYRLLQGLVSTIREVLPGADIVSFSDVLKARDEIRPEDYDIAFLDIEMPGMNGTDFAAYLREANSRINIIFTTGYSDYTGLAMQLHASGYIMKPVTPEKLTKELKDLRYALPSGSYNAFAKPAEQAAGAAPSVQSSEAPAAAHSTGPSPSAGYPVDDKAYIPGAASAAPSATARLSGISSGHTPARRFDTASAPASTPAGDIAGSGLSGDDAAGKYILTISAFGSFEAFVDDVPLSFRYSSKTKELLAYLIDRRGALCSNGELIGILWDDTDNPERKFSYLKNLRLDLISSLGRYGLESLVIRQRGHIAIAANSDRLRCDYYDFLDKKPGAPVFLGEYMEQYSWAEYTKGSLERVYESSL